ncbi:MAG TPA: phosphatase PAP2 family protein [Thermoanaerobaculia bacterium]|nr:phosphatase PAP2 family protein [Thermoanaerobaculia bacterium]
MRRPYFFEIFTVVNFAIIQIVLWRITRAPLATILATLVTLLPVFLAQALIGIGVRYAIRRGEYAAVIRSRQWIADSARIIFFSALSVHVYGWIKLSIPLLNPQLFDSQLWNIDRAMFYGHSPNIFFLDLFSTWLRFFDWTYANVFIASINIASMYFLSDPDPRLRIGFTNANTLMWLVGAWLYLAVPSLGPAYRFPSVWLPLSAMLPNTQQLQRILMNNYQHVLHNQPVNILLGIAAFPSLHVAFEALVTLWMRGRWRLLFACITLIIFLGSIITGWHYLIDSIAGVVLAILSYLAVAIPQRRKALVVANASTE